MDNRAAVLMSGSELLAACDVAHEQVAEWQSRQKQLLARLDQMGYAAEIGAHDTARLISRRYRLDLGDAKRQVKLATVLPKFPAVQAALPVPGNEIAADGVVLHMGQAEAIVSSLSKIPASANVPVEDLAVAEEQMVQAARHMTPSELRSLGAQIRNILDTDGPEPREDAARAREELWLKKADGGVRFGGYLSGENAEALETVIQAGAKPHTTADGAQDPRSPGKRQADALVDALKIVLDSGDLPVRGGIKPHITVTIDLDDLINAGKNATGDLAFGDGLSASAVRRLACDAGVIPVVLGSDSQPLDVGREYRFVTTGLRNALNQRDRGCVICGAPLIYCDAHHLVTWFDGGVTSIANLVLLCRVDHGAVHDGHWTVTVVDNTVQVSRPTWADPPPRSHQRPAPPSTPDANPPPAAAPWPSADTPAPAAAATTGAATCARPATSEGSRMASAASRTEASQGPLRAWPFTGDATWITAEETAALNPWPDTPTAAPHPEEPRPLAHPA